MILIQFCCKIKITMTFLKGKGKGFSRSFHFFSAEIRCSFGLVCRNLQIYIQEYPPVQKLQWYLNKWKPIHTRVVPTDVKSKSNIIQLISNQKF